MSDSKREKLEAEARDLLNRAALNASARLVVGLAFGEQIDRALADWAERRERDAVAAPPTDPKVLVEWYRNHAGFHALVDGLAAQRIQPAIDEAVAEERKRSAAVVQWLNVILDQTDYTARMCSPTDMVAAVLERQVIESARAALAAREKPIA